MKRTHLILFLSSLTLIKISPTIAQTITVDTMFWVSVNNPLALPLSDGTPITGSKELNALFTDYDVQYFGVVFPGANTPILKNKYKVACDGCNIDTLIKSMTDDFAYFSEFRKHEYENIMVHNPEDGMWQLTMGDPDEWLWHLKKIKADLAWDITTGDPNVTIGIIDTYFDLEHPDLESKFVVDYDPFDNQEFDDCVLANSGNFPHGTAVASFAGAETIEEGGTANSGQLASVGFKTMLIGYKAWSGSYLERAWHAATVMNVDVLTSSAGGWTFCPDLSGEDEAVVKEILDRGTVIVMPAGNGNDGTHNFCSSVDPTNHTAFFPLSPYYDDRIILVTSTDKEDRHAPVGSDPDDVHSHYPMVDLCAPGYSLMHAAPTDCGASGWPYYGTGSGTSYAAPIVAGTAALILSVNPCLSPSDVEYILKNTTDPVVDAASFTGLIGTGRINAYEAVLLATTYGNVAPITSNTTWSGDRFVKGTVTVSSGTLTINGTVRMAKDAKIVVNSGAILNVSGGIITSSSGCSEMWDGILVKNNGRLFVQANARIEDAKIGVDIQYGAYYYLNNSTFNRNHVHVNKAMPPSGTPIYTSDYRILRCKFLCQTTASLGGTPVHTNLLPPYSTMRTSRGIHATGVPKILVGSTLANANTFDNSDWGIYVERVKRMEVLYNNFRDHGIGAHAYDGPGAGGETINISNNDMDRVNYGILCHDHTKTVRTRITYNNIDYTGMVSPPTFMTGITVSEVTPAGGTNSTDYNYADISNNTILRAPCGIKLQNLLGDAHAPDAKLYVGLNYITHSKPDDNVQAGILLQNVDQPVVAENTINNLYGVGFTHWAETGIRIGTSSEVSLFCNTINNIGRAIWVDGDIRPNTHVVRNIMNNSQTGLLLNWGYVGQQGSSGNPRDNQWQGAGWNSSNPNTLVLGTGVQGNLSPFWVRNTPTPPSVYIPQFNLAEPLSTPVTINTTHGSWTAGCIYTEGASFKTDGSELDAVQEALSIVSQDEPETERGHSIRWMGEYNLYKKLMADEGLRYADESLNAFCNEKGEGSMGRLHLAVSGFNAARGAEAESVSDGLTALQSVQPQNRVEQTLFDVLSLLYANATDLRAMNDGEVEQLRDIALRCPLDDGLAVHVARAALLTIDTLPKGYMNECELAPPYNGDSDKENKVEDAQAFAVYPNPNNGRMTVSYALAEGETGILRVHNTVGLLVLERPLNASQGLMEVEMNGVSSGLYLLSVEVNNERKLTERISVVR